jgi:hypothetical protein
VRSAYSDSSRHGELADNAKRGPFHFIFRNYGGKRETYIHRSTTTPLGG